MIRTKSIERISVKYKGEYIEFHYDGAKYYIQVVYGVLRYYTIIQQRHDVNHLTGMVSVPTKTLDPYFRKVQDKLTKEHKLLLATAMLNAYDKFDPSKQPGYDKDAFRSCQATDPELREEERLAKERNESAIEDILSTMQNQSIQQLEKIS